jgi:hypothetical protein
MNDIVGLYDEYSWKLYCEYEWMILYIASWYILVLNDPYRNLNEIYDFCCMDCFLEKLKFKLYLNHVQQIAGG